MKVTVIIPNYNGEKFLDKCLNSLLCQTEKDYQLLIVDNGSTDESIQIIRNNFRMFEEKKFKKENLILMRLTHNQGFCAAVNKGIKRANTKYIILLNNDTEVAVNFIEESVRAIEGSDKIFSVSPKMIKYYQRDKLDNCGDYYTAMGWAFPRGLGQSVNKYSKSRQIFSSCGGAAIYRKAVLEEIGLFDERHFAYLEDVDIGYRARIHGYKNVYNPNAVVYHVGSGFSGSRYNEFKVRLSARNSIYLIYKNMPIVQLIINLLPIILGIFVKYLFFIRKGLGTTYLKGVLEGIRSFSRCNKVEFRGNNIKNYIMIEYDLIINTFIYIKDICFRN